MNDKIQGVSGHNILGAKRNVVVVQNLAVEEKRLLVCWHVDHIRDAKLNCPEAVVRLKVNGELPICCTYPHRGLQCVHIAHAIQRPIVATSFSGPCCVKILHETRPLLCLQNP